MAKTGISKATQAQRMASKVGGIERPSSSSARERHGCGAPVEELYCSALIVGTSLAETGGGRQADKRAPIHLSTRLSVDVDGEQRASNRSADEYGRGSPVKLEKRTEISIC
jgi:hypothetical protein